MVLQLWVQWIRNNNTVTGLHFLKNTGKTNELSYFNPLELGKILSVVKRHMIIMENRIGYFDIDSQWCQGFDGFS